MKENLTNRQIAFMLFGYIVGYGIMGLPKNIAESAGTGGWITLLIATAIAVIITYIFTYLGYIHENKTIYEYSKILTGKFITAIFMFIFFIEFFFFFTMAIRVSSEIIKLTVLIKTPVWALCLSFYLVIYYILLKGLRIMARVIEFYGMIIIMAYLIIHFLISTQGKLINIRPYFGEADIVTYFKSSIVTILPFLGIEILAIIPFNRKINNKKVFKYTVSMILFIGLFYILVVESCISVNGVDGIIFYKDALLATIRRIDVEWLQFLRRLDGIFLMAWIMSIFCTATINAYGAVFLIGKYFKKINRNLLIFIIVVISYYISQIPKTFNDVQTILDYSSYLGFATMGFIPILLLIITKVKKYDKKTK
ncbi:GerAB/ArcD/ProY family transporter [Wukongibacter sp. M2B1]|uniref:GerAB/ArcD/ProY family transporter n=1 Tax=Wukongibacter sp. M2B1 TaxID=3088895 RepID=UPI003D79367F